MLVDGVVNGVVNRVNDVNVLVQPAFNLIELVLRQQAADSILGKALNFSRGNEIDVVIWIRNMKCGGHEGEWTRSFWKGTNGCKHFSRLIPPHASLVPAETEDIVTGVGTSLRSLKDQNDLQGQRRLVHPLRSGGVD